MPRSASRQARRRRFDNPDQDPNHPANKTLSPASRTGAAFEADAFRMTSETDDRAGKDAAAGATGDATSPASVRSPAAEHTTGPVETIEDQGIGPRTPYPTGNPPPRCETTRSQGIKGAPAKNAPDKPLVKEPHR